MAKRTLLFSLSRYIIRMQCDLHSVCRAGTQLWSVMVPALFLFSYHFYEINSPEVLPAMPSGLDSVLDDNRIKRYMNNTLHPLMSLYGKDALPHIDKLLTYYYQLTDEGRSEVDKYLDERVKLKKDPKRAAEVKEITHW